MHSKVGASTEILPFLGCFIQVLRWRISFACVCETIACGLSASKLNEIAWQPEWAVQCIIQMENVGCNNSSVIAKIFFVRTMKRQTDALINQQLKRSIVCTANFSNTTDRYVVLVLNCYFPQSHFHSSFYQFSSRNRLHKSIHYSFRHFIRR